MKSRLLFQYIQAVGLALIGLIHYSCSDSKQGVCDCILTADFEMRGRVVNSHGEPLAGVEVVHGGCCMTGSSEVDEDSLLVQDSIQGECGAMSVKTDERGMYLFKCELYPHPQGFDFQDCLSSSVFGFQGDTLLYEPLDTAINMDTLHFIGGERYEYDAYYGKASIIVDVVLKDKK